MNQLVSNANLQGGATTFKDMRLNSPGNNATRSQQCCKPKQQGQRALLSSLYMRFKLLHGILLELAYPLRRNTVVISQFL